MVTSILECSCFRTFFQSLSVYSSQTLLKHALHHFHSNFPLICKKLSWKTSLLVRSTILGLLGNTFTADHMYSGHRWEKFPQQVQTLSSQQSKDFREFYSNIPDSRKFWAFRRKRSASWLKYSRIHLAWGMWFLQYPKAPVLQYPSRVKVFTGLKHCWNIHCSTCIPTFH